MAPDTSPAPPPAPSSASTVPAMHINDIPSPDVDAFSTPPTSPFPPLPVIHEQQQPQQSSRPALSRRLSRPQMIHIEPSPQGIQLDHSPNVNLSSPAPMPQMLSSQQQQQPQQSQSNSTPEPPVASAVPSHLHNALPPKSPCFVHSLLDKGSSLADWLRESGTKMASIESSREKAATASTASSLTSSPTPSTSSSNSLGWIPSPTEFEEEEDGAASLTRQLAATAVGVREMSKQLGRARVKSNIQNIMIITKARDNRLIKLTRDLALYLMGKPSYNGRGLVVYVDHQLRSSKRFDAAGIERDHPDYFRPTPRRYSSTSNVSAVSDNGDASANGDKDQGQLRYWTSDMCSKSPHLFDFVVTLGGDGTVLFTSWLFQKIVPPVLPFALGSLGFLTNFNFDDHRKVMDSVLENGIRVNLRMRFTCTVYRAVKPEELKPGKRRRAVKKGDTGEIMMKNIERGGWDALEKNPNGSGARCKDKEIMCYTTRPVETFEVINDLVVDRGPSPYVSLLELFGDEHHMTTVQADGLCVSTPTGSTAYSLSAGGSLVHPEIPAILITPICPHTLSFRPMLLPDSMELRICVPYNSRSTAWASFDGRGRVELRQGDHIKVEASKFPFPTVCADNQSKDWFNSISRTLKWNERERQKSFVVVEEGPEQPDKKKKNKRREDATPSAADRAKRPEQPPPPEQEVLDGSDEEDEDDEEEEEEEKFDIDDSAPEAAANAGNASSTNSSGSHMDISRNDTATSSGPSSQSDTEPTSHAAERAAAALLQDRAHRHPHHHLSHREGHGSGIETPGRFVGPMPHPPKVHSRHLIEQLQHQGQHSPTTMQSPPDSATAQRTPRPRDRMSSQTFSVSQQQTQPPGSAGLAPPQAKRPTGHRRGRSVGDAYNTRRTAFAVYGQDESDSNTSE